jgi:4'-phosphopantetheinyl transferase
MFARDRRDFTAAHVLLRDVLSRYGGCAAQEWRFDEDANGKPCIAADQAGTSPVCFNLSHTRGLVACAVAEAADVGIDVEPVGNGIDGRAVAVRFFAPSEIRSLEASPREDYAARFVELWTLKESYVKALGAGLAHPLRSFAFSFEQVTGLEFSSVSGTTPAGWLFALATRRKSVASHRHGERLAPMASRDDREYRIAMAFRPRRPACSPRVSIREYRGAQSWVRPLRWSPGVTIHCW